MTDKDQRAAKARELMGAIRHQVLGPEVTTMGPCAKGCGAAARGSGTCPDCLAHELDRLAGDETGLRYLQACEDLHHAERGVLRAVDW